MSAQEPVSTWRSCRIESALAGTNPTVMAQLSASFAVIGDVQFLPGYSVLLTNQPQVTRLSDLARPQRLTYLAEVDQLAEAVEQACAAADPGFRRVNIEILGNTDPFLHTHIWPRYEWEPDHLVGKPVWLYPPSHWSEPIHALGPAQAELRAAITRRLVVSELNQATV